MRGLFYLAVVVGLVYVTWKRSPRFRAGVMGAFWLIDGLAQDLRVPRRGDVARLQLRILRRIEGAARAGVWSERQFPTTVLVLLNPDDYAVVEDLASEVEDELENELVRRSRVGGNRMLGRPVIELAADGTVWRGWPRVRVAFLGETDYDDSELPSTVRLARPTLEPRGEGPTLLLAHDSQRIGRSGLLCDLTVADPSVSRSHCRIFFAGSRWLLEDAGATNGTYVNGRRVQGRHQLRDGDCVRLGHEREFRFVLRSPTNSSDTNGSEAAGALVRR